MRKPDFFIVGAPKCGTSAMYTYLKQHPDIFIPGSDPIYGVLKDLIYFGSSDLNYRHPFFNTQGYLDLFAEATSERLIGDACVWYLYSEIATYEIKEFQPSAKIIIMIRNPVDMIYSLHSQLLFEGNEHIKDFKAALEVEERRKRGEMPVNYPFKRAVWYMEAGLFAKHIKRYFDIFGRNTVHVIIYDDFKQNTEKVYKEALRFLGVDENFHPGSFNKINPNKEKRISNPFIRSLIKKLMFGKLAQALIPRTVLQDLENKLYYLNIRYVRRPPMKPELRRKLQNEFLSEIEELSKLLGRDLTFWCRE